MIAYELHVESLQGDIDVEAAEVAAAEAMEGLFRHLEQTLEEIGFADPRQSEKLHRRLRRLFLRARPSQDELNILRGILSAAQGRKSMRRE